MTCQHRPGWKGWRGSLQNWAIVCPRRGAFKPIDKDLRSRLDPWLGFRGKPGFDAWSLLAIVPRGENVTSAVQKLQYNTLSPLESLPSELIHWILDELDDSKVDLMALAISSKLLWIHVIQHIVETGWTGRLAGAEIACLGTHVTELPESFSEDGLALSSIPPDSERCTQWQCWPVIFRGAVENNFEQLYTHREEWLRAFSFYDKEQTGLSEDACTRLSTDINQCLKTAFDIPKTGLVLRNLVVKQFIRCCRREIKGEMHCYVDHPKHKNFRIEDIILLHISWSQTSASMRDRDTYRLMTGEWAGHSLDIVRLEENMVSAGSAWLDITNETILEAIRFKCYLTLK